MSYTSLADDEANFALNSCPTPPTSVTQMAHISASYQSLWEKYN